jgi:hypothetical protein
LFTGQSAEDKDKPTELDGKWKVVKEITDGKEMPGLFVNIGPMPA